MAFKTVSTERFPRRALLIMPLAFAGLAVALYPTERALPDAAEDGSGQEIPLTFFSPAGSCQGVRRVRRIHRSEGDWRHQLSAAEFAITRRQATEFAFANQYWNNHRPGMYRCVCCGTALFRSQDKFDSDTGWPSFFQPCAPGNIYDRPDSRLSETRTEVSCAKCDAHLGHVFRDGPPPTGLRYCLNSAALRLIPYRQT